MRAVSKIGSFGAMFRSATRRRIWMGGVKVSAVVGTILNLVNQGPAWMAGQDPIWGQMLLNYVVPFCVSVYSAARVDIRDRPSASKPDGLSSSG